MTRDTAQDRADAIRARRAAAGTLGTPTCPQETTAMPDLVREFSTLPLAERRILEDLLDRGIDPVAVTRRRHRTHIDALAARGLLTLDEWPRIAIVDEVAALVALGRACGDHDRPLPCPECE